MRKYLVVLAAAAAVGGGAVAVAVISGGTAAAQENATDEGGTKPDEQKRGHLDEVLGDLVAEGVITQDQADAVAEAIRDRVAAHREKRHDARRDRKARGAMSLEVVANVIGVDEAVVLQGLRDRQTLAEIAEANGSSAGDVVDALVAKHTARLDELLANGSATEERVAATREGLREKIEAFVNGELKLERRRGFRHHMPRFHDRQRPTTGTGVEITA